LDEEREKLRQARNASSEAEAKEGIAVAKVNQLKVQHAPLVRQYEKAKQAREQADHLVTETRTLLNEICERVKLFRDIAGQRAVITAARNSLAHIKQRKPG
jgi:hypothetical protein